jgi:hypothetical protein
MPRRALVIGIDAYDHATPLEGSVADAEAIHALLLRNGDGSSNYHSRLLTSESIRITRPVLREQLQQLFGNFDGDVAFYFSGHGSPSEAGGYLMTEDGERNDPGIPMSELLLLANRSRVRSVLLILDCCHSGEVGDPPFLQDPAGVANQAQLRQGLTILAASRPDQAAMEVGGHGAFTALVIGALAGGAADVQGKVSAAAVYAYVEQALGEWDQRPLYKSYADRLPPVRTVEPAVPDELLRRIPEFFPHVDSSYALDPSYEFTHETTNPAHVEIFKIFKTYRNARLLATEDGEDLYFVALSSKSVRLTPLGQFYWRIAALI